MSSAAMGLVNDSDFANSEKKGQSIESLEKPEIYKDFVKFLSLPKKHRVDRYGFETEAAFQEKNSISNYTTWNWKQREHFLRDLQLAQRTFLATNSNYVDKLATLDDNRLVREFREFVYPKDDKPTIQITNIEQLTHNDLDLFIGDIADMLNSDSDDD